MLGTETTPYDLRFSLLDIPVRIHPLFWLVTLAIGFEPHNLPAIAAWIGCAFVSILVHEFGHALMAKRFHGSPSIILYGFGGLCASSGERTDMQRLAVLLAGPGAGMVLGLLVMLAASAILGIKGPEHLAVIAELVGLNSAGDLTLSAMGKFPSELTFSIYYNLLWINLMWSLVNLAPIWPLDGGQIFQLVMARRDSRHGIRRSHVVGLLIAGIIAVWSLLTRPNDYFVPVLFGMLAFLNYQMLQTLQQSRSFGVYQNDDWWRR